MEKTNINVQGNVNVKAEGELSSGNCDPVIIIENGMVFTSQTDCAKFLGVSSNAVSAVICGRSRTCKGYHLISVSRLPEEADMLLSRLREASSAEEDAKKWREHQAEQERLRKEEEARLEAERKAQEEYEEKKRKIVDKIHRRKAFCNRIATSFDNATKRLLEAENEYYALTGEPYEDSIEA